jgi:hypothetical protein
VEVVVPRSVGGVTAQRVRIAADAGTGTLTLRFAADARGPFPAPLTVRATVVQDGKPVTAERTLELVVPQ